LLVSVLGTAWLLLCGFGLIRGTLLVAGIADGIETAESDPNAELAHTRPDLVDPSWFEHQNMEEERHRLETRMGWPLLAVCVLGLAGAIQLLRRGSRSRTLILLAGIGAIAWSAAGVYFLTRLNLAPAADLNLSAEIPRTFWTVAALNVALQSLPVAIGVGLLRHPAVRAWVESRRSTSTVT
jgi:hypothetical protein